MDSSCNRKTCKLSGDSIPELGDGEPSPKCKSCKTVLYRTLEPSPHGSNALKFWRESQPFSWDNRFKFAEAYAAAVSKNLQEERDEAISAGKHTQDWYARHYGKLHDWARKQLPEPYVNDFFWCIANGTTLGPDGKYFEMPSAYSQLLADQTTRAETAESRIVTLEKEIAAQGETK
jgi:hypothetical protein